MPKALQTSRPFNLMKIEVYMLLFSVIKCVIVEVIYFIFDIYIVATD